MIIIFKVIRSVCDTFEVTRSVLKSVAIWIPVLLENECLLEHSGIAIGSNFELFDVAVLLRCTQPRTSLSNYQVSCRVVS